MECKVYIENEIIGTVFFEIIDESMGVISGELKVNTNYKKYQKTIQKQTEEKGISNSENFKYRIVTNDEIETITEGGIGISDSKEFNEIIIESAGVNLSDWKKIK
ncbi:hypothetical protein OX283_012425 [Flavobacterium sp. SUN052]|uniref:hypothetical protein n=1 Tax=Flavobacterium sp. SUN052 TaxID=3002441 RepID=UPI00237E48D2|nr:hypothetical protein [Flavobacterium sp. SUN052]MEC4005467.1 hypothetical protein [Flavobacterium sp. SUN052]